MAGTSAPDCRARRPGATLKEQCTMTTNRTRTLRRLCVGVLGLLLAPVLAGCPAALLGAGAVAGAGAYKYVEGQATQTLHGGYEQVWDSSLNALQQMDLEVLGSERDALGGTIEARRAGETERVTVKVEPVDRDTTRVGVRVGVLGNDAESRRILQRIETTVASR
jgi:hypothetical protein